ncbi:hypothetical protein HPB48_006872 [Haemaphysalis longicornis]|uniref:ATP-dependent DNA helicase n=1 Tax=Haemaphysalis longicornis TaxID=44386 RepID=A0A9J6F771_HAELO|nr:hypothetical protein HPB48_006872 [Haemaphysalis longicornis]
MDWDEYYNLMRMTNAEKHELLREIINRQMTPSAPPLRVFFTGPAGCGKTLVLRLAMDLYNRYSNTGNNTAYNAFVISARASERRLWQWEEPRCTRLSSSLGRPPAPTRTEASAPAS